MEGFVTALTAGVTVDGLLGVVSSAAPIVITGVMVGFSYMIIKKAVSGLGKGKAKV